MAGVFKIALSGLRFFSNHGLYAEEAATGAEFEANILITYSTAEPAIEKITDTIDYVTAYEIVKQQVGQRSELLETTATKIAHQLKTHFNKIKHIQISITKLAPPIANFIGTVTVTYEQDY